MKLIKSRYFSRFCEKFLQFNRPLAVSQEFSRAAAVFCENRVKTRVFRCFAAFSQAKSQKKLKEARSAGHFSRKLKKTCFSQWKSLLFLRKSFETAADSFKSRKTRTFLAKILKSWRKIAKFRSQKREKLQLVKKFIAKRRALQQWRRSFLEQLAEKRAFFAAERKFVRTVSAKCLAALKKHRYFSKRTRKCRDFLKKKTENSLLLKVFRGFRCILSRKRDKNIKVVAFFCTFLKICFKIAENREELLDSALFPTIC